MQSDNNLKTYLQQHHSQATVYGYYRHIQLYQQAQPNAEQALYKDIVNYLTDQRKRYSNGNTIKAMLNAIKKYYDYLLYEGKRKDHPCRNLNMKDKLHKDVQLQDLLNEKELEALLSYQNKRFKSILETRDKAMLSLLIYQALTKKEINQLTTADINPEAGTVYIKATRTSNSRTLELQSKQVLLLYRYIKETRPALLSRNKQRQTINEPENLFITVKGKAEKGAGIKHILSLLGQQYERRITMQLIRQSVLALKLKKGNDIRVVQHFAGHKNASSTERYKAADIEELKAGISKYHPLQ